MTTYAVLGSTGNCGSALIQNLLQSPDNKIHAYCRNKAKLHRLLPETMNSKQVHVFEGRVDDVELMSDVVRGTRAVFLAATSNDNIPNSRVSQDSARAVILALQRLKKMASSEKTTTNFRPPRLVLLSSSTIDGHLARKMPWWFRPVMLRAASHIYADLRMTEKFLRSHSDWIPTVFIKPGGLSVDVARGHQLSLDEEESFISYLDLSAGMIEAADDDEGRYDGRNVGVVNAKRGVGARFPSGTPLCILMGLMRHFFPFLHPYLPRTGPQ